MKEERILNALGDISPHYIDEAAPGAARKPGRGRWGLGVLAACIGLLAVLGLPRLLPSTGPVDPAVETAAPVTPETDVPLTMRTSEQYQTLPELLDWLSGHEGHNSRMSDSIDTLGAPSVPVETGGAGAPVKAASAVCSRNGDYAYHIADGTVLISGLDGETTRTVGAIPEAASALFTWDDTLFLLRESDSVEEGAAYVRVGVYDISAPEAPALRDEYRQTGTLMACWMSGSELYLVTRDGVCVCGWSRLADSSGYYPALSHGAEALPWGDEELSILGQPTRVLYCAVTVFGGADGQPQRKRAFYGDIQSLFYGADWLALTVAAETESRSDCPVVYTFDRALRFTGPIRPAQLLGVPESNACTDWELGDGIYLGVRSVTKAGDIYRLLGDYLARDGADRDHRLLAVAADPESGEARAALLPTGENPYVSYTEILWEPERAVVCVAVTQNALTPAVYQETRFLFVDFDGLDIRFHENALRADYLNARVGVAYGNPLGAFRTLIPLGNRLYARYTGQAEGPGGFALYDFSDSAAPRRLSAGSGGETLDYCFYVYGPQRFGTLKVRLGETVAFRDVTLSWQVYTVAADGGVVPEQEVPLGGTLKTFFGADSLGLCVFSAGGQLYCVAPYLDAPVWLGPCARA